MPSLAGDAWSPVGRGSVTKLQASGAEQIDGNGLGIDFVDQGLSGTLGFDFEVDQQAFDFKSNQFLYPTSPSAPCSFNALFHWSW